MTRVRRMLPLAAVLTLTLAGAAHAQDRYSLVHGCFAVDSSEGKPILAGEGPFRMQAAALGTYLLYTPKHTYVVDQGGSLSTVVVPGTTAQWGVEGDDASGFQIVNQSTRKRLAVRFVPASGCATYPEADVSATGTPFSGQSPDAAVKGTIDAHSHITAFEFFGGDWHCGRPWSPYGAPYALPADCSHYQQGTNGLIEAYLDFGTLARPSDMEGWPVFRHWPSPSALAEEGTYYTGIKRAWMAGLRVLVVQYVDNEALCTLMTTRHNPCNDMSSVRTQNRDLQDLENYIDAQEGGPGKGWFRIVKSPFEAREAINDGKLAVVKSIELSRVLECGEYLGVSECDEAQVDARLDELKRMGITGFFPVHKFDNAFGGTAMDGETTGVIVNVGNRYKTGHFWNVDTCQGKDADSQQIGVPFAGALAQLVNGPLSSLMGGAAVPVYPDGPSCNQRGLTPLGAHLIREMIKRHFIIEMDHMDVETAKAVLPIITQAGYSGVVSSHSWDQMSEHPRLYADGGTVTPYPFTPKSAIKVWQENRAASDSRFLFGYGWGSDMNGLASQPRALTDDKLSYPFKSLDGQVTLDRERWGDRVFDINADGVANYGMYPDWIAAQAKIGGPQYVNDMLNGAEAYLEMWERADGVPVARSRPAAERFTSTGLGTDLRLGDTARELLFRAGQPSDRPGGYYGYRIAGSASGTDMAFFDKTGRVSLIASTAGGRKAGGAATGAAIARLSGLTTRRSGVWVGRRALAGGARFVYGVRRGRVRFVAIATKAELGSAGRLLRAHLKAAHLR